MTDFIPKDLTRGDLLYRRFTAFPHELPTEVSLLHVIKTRLTKRALHNVLGALFTFQICDNIEGAAFFYLFVLVLVLVDEVPHVTGTHKQLEQSPRARRR